MANKTWCNLWSIESNLRYRCRFNGLLFITKKKVNLENVCHWQSHRRHIRIWNELFTRSVYWHHILGLLPSFYEYRWPNDIPFMLVWGLFSIVLVKVLYPKISTVIEKIPYRVGERLTKILMVLVCLDCLISLLAVARQTLRNHEIPPLTPIDTLLDYWYPDEMLENCYPNMKFSK